jgi:hypothetical protein
MSYNFEILESDLIRHSRLRIGTHTVETPYWIMNNVDRKKLIKGLNLINYSQPEIDMNEIVIDFANQTEINSSLSNPTSIHHLDQRIHSEIKSTSENLVQFRLKDDIRLNADQLTAILNTQTRANCLSTFTIPDPMVGESGIMWEMIMTPIINRAKEFVETDQTKNFMPIISLNQAQSVINRKVQWLLHKQIPSIGFRAVGKFEKRLPLATTIINHSSNPVWIHLFDLSKKFAQLSQMHLIPLDLIDTISLKKGYRRVSPQNPAQNTGAFPTPVGIPLEVEGEEEPLQTVQHDLFDSRALGFFTDHEQTNFSHNLNCHCPICSKAHFSADELVSLLSQMERKSLLQVHEAVAFPAEFEILKRSCHDNDIKNYYQSKIFINQYRDKLAERYSIFEDRE